MNDILKPRVTNSAKPKVNNNRMNNLITKTNSDIFFSNSNTISRLKNETPLYTSQNHSPTRNSFETMKKTNMVIKIYHKKHLDPHNPGNQRSNSVGNEKNQSEEIKEFGKGLKGKAKEIATYFEKESKHLSAKEIKIANLTSNIFHNTDAKCNYLAHHINTQEKKIKPKEEYAPPKSSKKRSNWISNLAWHETNTELLLKTEPSERAFTSSENTVSPGRALFTESSSNYKKGNHKEKDLIKEEKREIESKMNNAHVGKIGKQKEQISSLHDKNFYFENLQVENRERGVKNVKIDNIKNFDNFDVSKVKSMFNSKGIHVFDVKPKGQAIGNGNSTGTLTFKIRLNENLPEFDDKVREISKKLELEGLEVEDRKTVNNMQVSETFPSDMNWASTQYKKGAVNKNGNNSNNTNSTGLNLNSCQYKGKNLFREEKFKSIKDKIDHSYKSNYEKSFRPISSKISLLK